MKIINYNIPAVSLIIEREKNNETEILIQTRWKPDKDPVYSGCIEIPGGCIETYENIYETIKREVKEETGLKVIKITPDIKSSIYKPRKDAAFAFLPFCCEQQLKNGKPWIGFVFICQVENKIPVIQESENKDVRWINKNELKEIFENSPEKIFTFQLGVFDFYFNKEKYYGQIIQSLKLK